MDQTADEPAARPPDPARPASALATVRASLRLLDARDRRRYRFALLAQVLLAGLDLLGVLLLGLVGLVTTAAATNTPPPQALTAVVATAGLQQTPMTTIAIGLGVAAGALLTGKGLLALLIQRRVALFLSERVAGLSRQLAGGFLSQSLPEIHHRPRQWVAHAFVDGLTHAVIGVLNYALIAVGDIAVLAALGATLLFVDPVTTSITVAYFAAATHVTNRWLATWAHRVGSVATSSAIGSRAAILDAVATYREAVAGGRREFFVDRFAQLRASNARTQADAATLLTVPRFTMEIALVPGAAILIAVLVVTGGSPAEVVGSMALFLAAIARAMPSLIRLNSGLIGIRTTGSEAAATLELWEQVPRRPAAAPSATAPAGQARGPLPVVVDAVTLHYPGRRDPALDSVSLTVPAGRSLALVGPSGAGKSSLVDVLLGVATPSAGTALIAGLPAPALVAQRPGALAYVPQDVAIIHGTVRDNVALGLTGVDDADVWTALDRAHLGEFVRAQPETLDTAVGDQGVRLSGGQRQRLGLARALLTTPSVLVLDEATSALDAETERAIADTIAALGTAVTTITVAHRLATIRSADIVAYLERGRLVAAGSFADVRAAVPSFERQARLLGL